jgi:hypothetical protein
MIEFHDYRIHSFVLSWVNSVGHIWYIFVLSKEAHLSKRIFVIVHCHVIRLNIAHTTGNTKITVLTDELFCIIRGAKGIHTIQ